MAPRLGVINDVSLLLVLLAASSCAARDFFVVDGPDGWMAYPTEQFRVKDTLVFVNDKDADGVLLVSPTHHGACNTSQPFLRLDGRETRFVLNNRGYYYFISADAGHCRDGERLIVFIIENKGIHTHSPLPPPPPPPPIPKSSLSSAPLPAQASKLGPSSSSSAPPPPPPKSASSSSSAPAPAPSKPGPPSSSAPPPPTPRVLPPAPPSSPSAGNASSPSPAPLTAPVEPTAPSTSSAAALRAGILACFSAAAVL